MSTRAGGIGVAEAAGGRRSRASRRGRACWWRGVSRRTPHRVGRVPAWRQSWTAQPVMVAPPRRRPRVRVVEVSVRTGRLWNVARQGREVRAWSSAPRINESGRRRCTVRHHGCEGQARSNSIARSCGCATAPLQAIRMSGAKGSAARSAVKAGCDPMTITLRPRQSGRMSKISGGLFNF